MSRKKVPNAVVPVATKLPPEMVARIDEHARRAQSTRYAWIQTAIILALAAEISADKNT